MKIKKTYLKKLLTAVTAVPQTGKVTTLLSYCHLHTIEGYLYLTVSDMSHIISITLGETTDTFDHFVKFKELKSIVSDAITNEIELVSEPDKLLVKAGVTSSLTPDNENKNSSLKEHFPHVNPELSSTGNSVMYDNNLLSYTEQVISFVEKTDNRYVYNGIFFDGTNMVATDGRKLAKVDTGVNTEELQTDNHLVIHNKAMSVLVKLMKAYKPENIRLSRKDLEIELSCGDFTIQSRLLEGYFPAYEKVIPTDYDTRLVVDRKQFLDICKALKKAGEKPSYQTYMDIVEGKLTMECGESTVEVPVESQTGTVETLYISFNCTYLIDVCNSATGKTLTLDFQESHKPLTVTTDQTGYVALVMPIK